VAVLAAVHDQLYGALLSAKSAYESRALDEMCRHAERVAHLLTGLENALNFETAQGGAQLAAFYRRTRSALNRIQHDPTASAVLQETLITLRSMCSELRLQITEH
jgi:flagellin-specific chaperone FliS